MSGIDLRGLKPPYLIHVDTFRSIDLAIKHLGKEATLSNLVSSHFETLCYFFGKENIIIPAFNYDFPKTGFFSCARTPIHVGQLPNHILEKALLNRTPTPIFSFLTDISELRGITKKPFSDGSVFDFIRKENGSIIFYGTDIKSCTYLHYVEDILGPPLYRYDKNFSGIVDYGDSCGEAEIQLHVRPAGLAIDYDWASLDRTLDRHNAKVKLSASTFAINAQTLFELWGEKFSVNQLQLLDFKSRKRIGKHLNPRNLRLRREDFESEL